MRTKRIAYFISPHGFGHAARAAAVMEVLSEIDTGVQFEIFTTVPSWFFQDSMSAPYAYHHLVTDIGLVQKNAFQADFEDTLQALNDFFPPAASLIAKTAETVKALNCVLVICEIAPMGILVAKEAGLPSILVENFTWDWIYQQYTVSDKRINRHIEYLQPIFNAVDYHIQTEPVCSRNSADLITAPVSRKIKMTGDGIRARLGLPADDKMVLITTGGIPQSYGFLEKLNKLREITFVMPGAGPEMKIIDNSIVLPARSDFYHPDLINAADAVIGKVGYSTLAEIYHGGVPFGYVARSNFRESESMVEFIQKQMPGIAVSESEFNNGNWTAKLADLLDLAPVKRNITNGAEQISIFIEDLLQLS
jgi:UDP-N-acetylglucosamine:LPS N-acetylglucosamine transferase